MALIFLIAIFCGFVFLIAPIWLIALSVRSAKLRRQLAELTEETAKQQTKLQRAIGELQTRLAATSADTAGTEKAAAPEVRQQVPVPRSFPVVPIPPTPVVPPAKSVPPVPGRVEVKPPITPVAPVPPVSTTPPQTTAPPAPPGAKPPAPPELKPLAPATQALPHVEPKPATPTPPPKVTTPAHVPHVPPPHTPPAAEIPRAAAARISTPATASPLRMPATKTTLQQRMKAVSSIEELLGANWFAKLGVIMTVIGMALLGKLALQHLGPTGKAFIVYAVSLLFLVGGIFLEKHDRYQLLGRVGIGGGWALLFFSTFGIHYVPAMQILDSGIVDSVLMLLVAVAMGAHTLRYRSQLVTGIAFLLGYTTVALSQDTVYSLTAGVMLAIGLVGIVLKMGWFELEVFGILASYLNHLYWLFRLLGIQGAHGRAFPEYHASLALVFFYWLIFRVSYVARGIKTGFEERVSAVAAILNTLLLLGTLKFQSVNPELAYIALFAIGALELVFALLPITRKRRQAFVLLSILGTSLVIAAVPSHYSGNDVAILWLVGAEVFLAAGILFEEVVFRRLGLFTGVLVGADLIFFNFRPLLELRAKSEALFLSGGLLFALCALVFYLNALYIASRWDRFFSSSLDRALLILHSYLGAFAAATAAWALFSNDWTAVVFAAIMLTLAALNRRIASRHLQIQYALLGILTLYRALVFNLHIGEFGHPHIATRLITLPLLGAMFYATAKMAQVSEDQSQRIFRALFSFAGAFLFGLLIWTEAPGTWMAALFLAAGIILAFAARHWDLLHLSVQEHLFAIAAVFRTLDYNGHVAGHYGPFSIRLITVSLVAAGLYAVSRRATNPSASHGLVAAYLHTTAATFLLALLMWYEASTGWLVALWALFALALTLVDRRFQLDDLRWQAHALAAITLVRCIGINLTNEELWHNISVRLLTLSTVAVIFYAMSLLIRMPEEWRARDFHHIYSWSASLLVCLLLWYELDPLGRAVGWAVFGFVLFEYGLLRKIPQYRYQAYVSFIAAFARIFFANLTAGLRGELFGPRMYTVLPLILIFFFVYAQLAEEQSGGRSLRFRSDVLVAYLGTAALVALFYFQFDLEWVVVSYAGIALALFATASATKREVFLHQGILVTLGTFARGMAHNLFGSSNFANGDWTGRYMIVSIAVAILLATLFFAFPLRESYRAAPDSARRGRLATLLIGHPEQLQFFVPVILVMVMLALKTSEGMITVSWGTEGLVVALIALLVRERSFLLAGFGILSLCIVKVFAMDIWRFDLLHKVIVFIGVGLAALAVSILYYQYSDRLRQYL
ncbi:MAG TPA: DUF2339 domain-containing protein [Candidatus Methylomirabilis sp.]|nr:DUF2339 domain-containing protein [Candidatus Methylomirabilis sp.]